MTFHILFKKLRVYSVHSKFCECYGKCQHFISFINCRSLCCFHNSLPLATLPLCSAELNWSQLYAIICRGQSGKVIDLLTRRCLVHEKKRKENPVSSLLKPCKISRFFLPKSKKIWPKNLKITENIFPNFFSKKRQIFLEILLFYYGSHFSHQKKKVLKKCPDRPTLLGRSFRP